MQESYSRRRKEIEGLTRGTYTIPQRRPGRERRLEGEDKVLVILVPRGGVLLLRTLARHRFLKALEKVEEERERTRTQLQLTCNPEPLGGSYDRRGNTRGLRRGQIGNSNALTREVLKGLSYLDRESLVQQQATSGTLETDQKEY